TARDAARHAAYAVGAPSYTSGDSNIQSVAGTDTFAAGRFRRRLRTAGRLSYRPAGPTTCADMEHFPVWRLGLGVGVFHVDLDAAVFPLHDVHRSLRRIRRRCRLASRTVSQPQAARARVGLHAVLLVVWRHPSRSCLPMDRRAHEHIARASATRLAVVS